MDSNVQTLCLIALGVGFLILIAAALLLSVLRGSVFGLGMMVMRMISEPQKEETTIDVNTVRTQSASENLRARAQSLDFDATVAQYRQNDAAAHSTPNGPFNNPSPIPPPDPATQGFPPPNAPPPNGDEPLHRS